MKRKEFPKARDVHFMECEDVFDVAEKKIFFLFDEPRAFLTSQFIEINFDNSLKIRNIGAFALEDVSEDISKSMGR